MLHDRFDPGGYNPPPRFHPPRPRPPADRHPDRDTIYRRPRAWLNAKRAFGVSPGDPRSGGDAGRAMVLLERFAPGCPRYMLAVAVHLFLSLSREAQWEAMEAHGAAVDAAEKPRIRALLAGEEGTVDDA